MTPDERDARIYAEWMAGAEIVDLANKYMVYRRDIYRAILLNRGAVVAPQYTG
jgi:Mor family transcriptional regulator